MSRPSEKLFAEAQSDFFEKSYEEHVLEEKSQPVECLGMTFTNDEERRKHFFDKLREKLKDLDFRKIEGFPIGSDEDILALSDPPYYTACPNPFIADFIAFWEATKRRSGGAEKESITGSPHPRVPDAYRREPFAVDVSEGKTDPLYKAHSYHTKVPHLAIVPSILHYTEPGDAVLDGFCGSGMTGVAALWCGTAPDAYRRMIDDRFTKQGREKPRWGARRVLLNDLSPAATFITENYTRPFDTRAFAGAGRKLLDEIDKELGWMYDTRHTDGRVGRIEYTVWSEVFRCPECTGEVVFLEEALDEKTKRVREIFPCPHCSCILKKERLERVEEARHDPALKKTIRSIKRKPVLICYKIDASRFEKKPDRDDLDTLGRIAALEFPGKIPTIGMMHCPNDAGNWGDKWRAGTASFSHVHHLFLPRAAHTLSALWRKANAHADRRTRHMLLFFVEQAIWGLSLLNRYGPLHFSQVNRYLNGVYYIASQHAECSPWYILAGKLSRLTGAFPEGHTNAGDAVITTGDASRLGLPDAAVDYIFTDPPFGDNLAYGELNYIVEAFHRCFTNMQPEAIISSFQKKGLYEYQRLMQRCFDEYCRVLKPGRWMTVVFHNSRNAVWNVIQEGLQRAGFVVADVRILDKQQGSFNQGVAVGSVKQDLVISAYKPNGGLEERFKLEAGTEEGVWDFVRTHLMHLPIFVARDGKAEVVAERQNYLLFDRMVAFHVQRGITVPLSAAEFYQGLTQRFSQRDGMFFLPEQAVEYDRKRLTVQDILQIEIAPYDEASSIEWLRQQLTKKPQTFSDLHPQFLKEIGGWQKHEKPMELSELLEQNFLRYDGKGEVPKQIHSYLSTNFKELRNLPKDDENLRAKGKDRWYVPDPNKAGDLEKLRERSLLKEFEGYRASGQKRLKVFRLEAVRAGFKKAWQEHDYATIITVARKIPENVLQEDPKLLMWYDQALTRTGEQA